MSSDLSKAYELLGVKPGVSMKELKAAHRDLAKVWHPDRFLHDPRLQQKAQEKLKEINEAYDLISSGKIPRPAPQPPTEPETTHYRKRSGTNWQWAVVFLVVFAAVFAITTRKLLRTSKQPFVDEPKAEQAAAGVDQDQPARPDSNTRAEAQNPARKSKDFAEPADGAATEVTAPVSIPTEPVVTTVTVTIDPETGLLAKPECPLRSRMSYPIGSQPTAYCNLSHAPPPKDSRIKSIAKTVKRTLD